MTNQRPEKRLVGALNNLTVEEARTLYAASESLPKCQLIRPFSVFSKNTYSAPVMLPIGLAYVAALARDAGYPIGVIDAVGEAVMSIRATESGDFNQQGLNSTDIIDLIPADTQVVGLTLPFSQEWVEHRRCIEAIKAAYPSIVICLGGEPSSTLLLMTTGLTTTM